MQTHVRPAPHHAVQLPRPAGTRRPWLLTNVVLAAALLCSGQAVAQLMVHPTRVVLDNDQRSSQLEIINNSDKLTVYRIELVNRRMDESGGFSSIETALPGEQFAGDMIRYSPRRVALAPGASQIIRVMARKPADLAAGEYRSHLLFAEQQDAAAPPPAAATSGSGQIGVSLTALVGVSIPVIVRHGKTAAEVSLGKLALAASANGGPPVLSLEMSRTGNRSVHGDLAVDFLPAGGGAAITVARAGGVAVYTPNLLRQARLPLVFPAGTARSGTLHVTYREPPERGGALLAEGSLPLH